MLPKFSVWLLMQLKEKKKNPNKMPAPLVNIPWKAVCASCDSGQSCGRWDWKGRNEMEMNISRVTLQRVVIDSNWCGRSRTTLHRRTEIAGMLQVLNKCRRVKGSAVTRAGVTQREGATESGRPHYQTKPTGHKIEIHSHRFTGSKKTGRTEGTGSC